MKWRLLLIISVFVLLQGCSAEWHLKTALKKNPSMQTWQLFTKVDTVVTPPIAVVDTVLIEGDSVVIENDTVSTTIIKYNDRYIVKTKVKPITLYRTVTIPVKVIEYKEQPKKVWASQLWWQIIIAICCVVGTKKLIDRVLK